MGLPESVVGITKPGSSRADADTKSRDYINDTIRPHIEMIFSFFNDRILPDYERSRELELVPIIEIPGAREHDREDAGGMLGGANTIVAFGTVNEARARMKLKPLDDGDYIPEREHVEMVQREYKNNRIKYVSDMDDLTTTLVNSMNSLKKKDHKCDHSGGRETLGDETFTDKQMERVADAIKRRDTYEETYTGKVDYAVRKFNAGMRDRVIDRLELIYRDAAGDVLIDKEEEEKLLINILLPISEEVLEKIGDNEMKELTPDVSFNVKDTGTQTELQTYTRSSVVSYVNTIGKTITNVVEEGIDKGLGLEQISRNIRKSFDGADKVNARRLARTAVFNASNQGFYNAAEQSGVVESLKWYNPAPCPYCAVFNGQTRRVGELFAVRGEHMSIVKNGKIVPGPPSATVWMDTKYPPIHVNCRCVLIVDRFT